MNTFRLLPFFCFIIISTISIAQPTEYLCGNTFRYFVGTQEPENSWNTIGFDDTQWLEGYGVLGFGNDNDSTIIPQSPSAYVRTSFEVADISAVEKYSLLVDYDDGFIAYINGVEVIRVNMGAPGSPTTHTSLATRSREMQTCRPTCYPLLGYYLDSTILNTCLVQGINVFAIQVHNDSLQGSDIGIAFALTDISKTTYSPYDYTHRAIKQVKVDSTHLPIVKITTDELGIYNCKKKITAHMNIIHSQSKNYNRYNDSSNVYWGAIGIEPRGQSSLQWPKKNYSIELRNAQGEDSTVSILGMPKESDWILHGPFADRSLIRNALAYTLSSQLGQYAPRTRFCELFINDEYMGVYVLMESIKRDKNRVDIKKLNPENTVDVTGGYIMKYDKDVSTNPGVIYPKSEDITVKQKEYISTYYKNYINAMHDSVILHPSKGYRAFVDVPSFLDFTIINELVRNPDAYLYSTYYYKNSDDISSKLHFGPVWDFDLAFANSNFQGAKSFSGWQFARSTNNKLHHTKVFKDTVLVQEFNERWVTLRSKVLHSDTILKTIDSLLVYLGDAIERNKQVWMQENHYIMGLAWNQYISQTYDEDIYLLKQWIVNRSEWMDANISDIYYKHNKPVEIESIQTPGSLLAIYPIPCKEFVTVRFYLTQACDVQIALHDIQGNQIQVSNNSFVNQGDYLQSFRVEQLPSGIYIIHMNINNQLIHSQQIIKQ